MEKAGRQREDEVGSGRKTKNLKKSQTKARQKTSKPEWKVTGKSRQKRSKRERAEIRQMAEQRRKMSGRRER